MAQMAQRAAVRGPTFIRLLARLTDVGVPPSRQSLPDRLSQWLDWTHAIALSTALDGKAGAAADGPAFDDTEAAECARLRAALADAITSDPALTGAESSVQGADYAVFRRRYQTHQRAMQATAGKLRGRLRDRLVQQGDTAARLGAVDAVMEAVLSPREHSLLARIPTLLGERFERLHQAELNHLADASSSDQAAPNAWLDLFRRDMQSVLLAELDVRFQPIEALLAALRTAH